MPTVEEVKEALKDVIDPELGFNVVDLGFIYEIKIPQPSTVEIKMTMTIKGCPLASFLSEAVKQRVLKMPGVENAKVELVWDPPWNPSMVSEELRKKLGI